MNSTKLSKRIDPFELAMEVAVAHDAGLAIDWKEMATRFNSASANAIKTCWYAQKRAFVQKHGASDNATSHLAQVYENQASKGAPRKRATVNRGDSGAPKKVKVGGGKKKTQATNEDNDKNGGQNSKKSPSHVKEELEFESDDLEVDENKIGAEDFLAQLKAEAKAG